MKQQYRITTYRFDVSTRTHSEPTFEGETVEACDKQALDHLRELSAKPENEWEGMGVFRIDAPAVAEKVTFLGDNGKQNGGE